MNILEISVRSDIGGGPKHLLDLLSEFSESEINVYSAIPYNGEYSGGIKKYSSRSIEIPHRRFTILSFIRILIFIRKHKITVVHSHGRGAGIYSRLLKLFGLKVIHTFHGVHFDNSIIGHLKLFIDKFLKNFTDTFICVSESEKFDALRLGLAIEVKTSVIINGVDVEVRKNDPENKILKFGTLSRLNYQKGLDILIDFFKLYSKRNDTNFVIEIAGDGELESELKSRLVKNDLNNIKFIGPTSKPIEFLSSLDGYLSFSRWEGMPLAVLEAMGVGVPCLLSNVQGNKDLVNDGEDGLLFELDSYVSFEKKLKIFLEDKALRDTISNKAQQKIQTKFTTKKMAQKTLELYR